jgi:hypothetical protein
LKNGESDGQKSVPETAAEVASATVKEVTDAAREQLDSLTAAIRCNPLQEAAIAESASFSP